MTEHFTADDLRRYLSGQAAPAELLAMDDHLTSCEQCRARMSPSPGLAEWAEGLGDSGEPHLTHAQLVARVENRTADSDRFAVEAHLKQCAACREEVADLARFRQQLQNPSGGEHRRWMIPAAIAALLVLGVWFGLRHESPAPVAHFQPPAAWSQQDRDVVNEAIARGSLPFAAPTAELEAKPGTLLGSSTADAFAPLSPVGALVESDRPEFRWSELAGAASYRVEIFDANFLPVARSGEVRGTNWTPADAIPRGIVYRWQIVATKAGKKITVPTPPAPEARFRILDRAAEEAIERARTQPDGHLLAAVLLARAGLHDEAVAELKQVDASERRFPEIQALLDSASR